MKEVKNKLKPINKALMKWRHTMYFRCVLLLAGAASRGGALSASSQPAHPLLV